MNLRRLNHILIPGDPDSWERWSRRPLARALGVIFAPLLTLTPEGMAVLVVTLLVGAAGMDVQFSKIYLVFCGLFGLLLAAWIGRLIYGRPGSLAVHMSHPARVAAGEVITFSVELHNPGRRPLYALRVFGPFLPWDGAWVARRPAVARLAPGERARVETRARFRRRGHRPVGRFFAASVRPLGLAMGRKVRSAPVRIIVVPHTARLRGLAPPPMVPEDLGARARGITSGTDYELAGLRPYRPGDRIRDLHALSWARLGEPMVRTFRRTARRRAVVLLHTQTQRGDEGAFEAAVSVAASLTRWAVEQGALTTLVVMGAQSRAVVVGPQSAPVDVALDVLAVVAPCALVGPEALGHLARARERGVPVYAVFAEHGPHLAAAREPLDRLWVVGDRRARQAATAAGVPALSPADCGAPELTLP